MSPPHDWSPRIATGNWSTPTTPPAVATADSLDEQVNRQVYESLANPDVPANLTPSLADAAADAPVPEADGCFDGFTETSVNTCLYGDTTSSHTVVLFGDSHALQWFPAIDNLANQQHDALVVMAKATCPPIDITIFSPDLGRTYTECNEWRASELQRMTALRPAVVILGFSREYGIPDDHVVVDGPAWLSGLSEMINTIKQETGGRVVLIGDDPYPQQSVPDCLSQHLAYTPDCCDSQALSLLQSQWDYARKGSGRINRRRLRRHRLVVLHRDELHCCRGEHLGIPRRQPHHRDIRQLAHPGYRRTLGRRHRRRVLTKRVRGRPIYVGDGLTE